MTDTCLNCNFKGNEKVCVQCPEGEGMSEDAALSRKMRRTGNQGHKISELPTEKPKRVKSEPFGRIAKIVNCFVCGLPVEEGSEIRGGVIVQNVFHKIHKTCYDKMKLDNGMK